MAGALTAAGFEMVDFSLPADVYIVNTCTVTKTSDHKSRQMLRKARNNNPSAIIVAAGCYPQVAEDKFFLESFFDLAIGNTEKEKIAEIIMDAIAKKTGKILVSDISKEKICSGGGIAEFQNIRANIKIEDGCNNFCSYCIIPKARGRVRSRRIADIKAEFDILARSYPEIVLTGIEISSFGADTGESLQDLIAAVAREDIRLRLGSLEPRIVTESFIEKIKTAPGLCPHFHLSLQSGCDKILKAMNRKYSCADYLAALDLIRANFESPGITTDIIVGFPGETEQDFLETCEFVKKAGFSKVHIFPFSERDGTPAAKMADKIPNKEKSQRAAVLSKICDNLAKEFAEKMTGHPEKVLFEEFKGGAFEGYTANYMRAKSVLPQNSAGQVLDVIITGNNEEILICERK